jgi:hypothetical protein
LENGKVIGWGQSNYLSTETNIISIFLTTNLKRETVTKNAIIPAVLRLGTNNIKTQKY